MVAEDGGHAAPAGAPMVVGTPAGAPWDPRAIAGAAVHLASDEASSVHGTVLDVDGGRLAVVVVAGA